MKALWTWGGGGFRGYNSMIEGGIWGEQRDKGDRGGLGSSFMQVLRG